ncbi:MAG: DUF3127 domain-containing protein [Cytophagales bacterium]|nr:DUF3127 domain-containing protein [Cytophagales bacterium]
MNIQGKIRQLYDAQQVSDRFRKREFVIEYLDNPQYPQYVKFEVVQDSCSLLDSFKVGDEVDVSFNLRGREWINPQGEAVYFNTLNAWRITPLMQQPANIPPMDPMQAAAPPAQEPPTWTANSSEEDDLPF